MPVLLLLESKKIEMLGGYQFQNVSVPNSFNFGGAPPHPQP